MSLNTANQYISQEDYLTDELISEFKREYINGYLYPMADSTVNHNRLMVNVSVACGNHLHKTNCDVFHLGFKVKANNNFFYPDVLVICNDEQGDDYYTEKPLIIVEVLSKSTRQRDKTTKLDCYKTLASLQEYLLIEQDFVEISLYRRANNWQVEYYYLGDTIHFNSIDLTLAIADIYARVNNEDMRDYLSKLATTENTNPL
ncbi:MAG: Uma2 family endonuclease [Methylococcaceae bacterium]